MSEHAKTVKTFQDELSAHFLFGYKIDLVTFINKVLEFWKQAGWEMYKRAP
jgi:hypothetical protein